MYKPWEAFHSACNEAPPGELGDKGQRLWGEDRLRRGVRGAPHSDARQVYGPHPFCLLHS